MSTPIIRVFLNEGDAATARNIQALINGERDTVDFPGVIDGEGGEVAVRFQLPDPTEDGPETIGITLHKTWQVAPEAIRELAVDLITSAVEGAINYWAHVSDYHWGGPNGHSDRRPVSEGDTSYATVIVHEDEASVGDAPKEVRVNVATMVETIRKVVAGDVKPFYNPGYSQTCRERLIAVLDRLDEGVSYSDADPNFDADDGDSMMQIAVLGEIIYG